MTNSLQSIGVMSVATNIYINYWKSMILSLDAVIRGDSNVVSHIFTDQPEEAKQLESQLKVVKLNIHAIEPYVWPEATLLRYKIFLSESNCLIEDILIHLDADMLVHRDPLPEIVKSCSENDVNLVSHPGYWRQRINPFSIRDVYRLFTDKVRLQHLLSKQPMGSWENNMKSKSFVPKKKRRNYVCGGTWFGNRSEIIELLSELARLTETDLSNGIIPVWHDESILNHWASENSYGLLSPSFCYVDEYKYLESLPRIIQAEQKMKKQDDENHRIR